MIQPHLPIRLPCYDFTPIIEPTFGRAPLAVRLRTSGDVYKRQIQRRMTAYCAAGLPHSDIPGSMDICSSPRLFAACHVLLRLLMPRHSPCALSSLTCSPQSPLTSISTLLWEWESRPLPELSEKSWFSFKELCRLHRFLKL